VMSARMQAAASHIIDVEPKLCRDCRFCRPTWWVLAVPIIGWIFWRSMWQGATCRHPSAQQLSKRCDPVLGIKSQRVRLACTEARRDPYSEPTMNCGSQARYWHPRRVPAWFRDLVAVAAGLAFCALYALAMTHRLWLR